MKTNHNKTARIFCRSQSPVHTYPSWLKAEIFPAVWLAVYIHASVKTFLVEKRIFSKTLLSRVASRLPEGGRKRSFLNTMMSYIILFQHLNKCPVRDVIVFPSFQRFRVDGRKRFEYATLYMWTHTFSKTEEKFFVFKNIRMLVGRSLKDLVLLGTRPKFEFRRAAECLKPCWLTLFMTKKILKYPYPVQENTLNSVTLFRTKNKMQAVYF